MPRNKDIQKVLVIGSGPIIIGQAAEFDYSGTQACRTLKAEDIEVLLINSNPATIMTDKNIADMVYIEPLTIDIIKKIIIKEKPDSILPTLGGQTGLNLAMELEEDGFLKSHNINLLGMSVDTIKKAEDRQMFKDTMEKISEPIIASKVVNTTDDAINFAKETGYPIIVRPGYTLGGTGGGIAENQDELIEIAYNGIRLSRVGQVLIEKNIAGWKEIEFEVIRDNIGNCVAVCDMENIDPVGVHTGDSIVVAPSQTLNEKDYNMLKTSAFNIVSELRIKGGCNVQFALNPTNSEYAIIEVNPRVSRSSALASKATGYPIAKIATKIAIGYNLDEINNSITGKTFKDFEPYLDYIATKIPKWPFDKFVYAKRTLGTQMKATGEVMAISSTIEAGIMKAIRSLELGLFTLELNKINSLSTNEVKERLHNIDDERIFIIAQALRRKISIEEIHEVTKIDVFFLKKIENLINMENKLKSLSINNLDKATLIEAKNMGYTDDIIANFLKTNLNNIKEFKKTNNIFTSYKKINTYATELKSSIPYYYSTYIGETKIKPLSNKSILVLGSGPIRIGQGIEFDYCSVHSVWALSDIGYKTIIVNNNPETVSTDFDTADRLYFEPLTDEDIENIVQIEKPYGAIVQFGGQTAIKLTKKLKDLGVNILGTSQENIDAAEDREKFNDLLRKCNIPQPAGSAVYTLNEALKVAKELGYPVLVRPSYVIGGQGMEIAFNDNDVKEFMQIINRVKQEHPILIDKYLLGKELEVDAISDGEDILIPGIMEHLERAGVHSGDSISVYPPQTISERHKNIIVNYTCKLAKALDVKGIINIQFVLYDDKIYVIEVNPRSSRTVPYISKVTNIPMVNLATKVVLGYKLKSLGYGTGLYKESNYVAIKVPVFSFEKLHDVDISLGPEMKSTGEVLGISNNFSEALYKGLIGAGFNIPEHGNILITVKDSDKQEIIPIAQAFEELGYKLYATGKTALTLNKNYVATNVVKKIGEGYPDILDLIQSGKINLVINTPTRGRQPKRDGFKIRRKSVEYSVPCLTSLDTAKAVIESLKTKKKNQDIKLVDINKI